MFSKLRFSYVEQLTKENFLRKITSPEPPFIESQENQELEARLAKAKAELKSQKTEIAELIAELDRKGRELSQCKVKRRRPHIDKLLTLRRL